MTGPQHHQQTPKCTVTPETMAEDSESKILEQDLHYRIKTGSTHVQQFCWSQLPSRKRQSATLDTLCIGNLAERQRSVKLKMGSLTGDLDCNQNNK
jgi:hypothetical protein